MHHTDGELSMTRRKLCMKNSCSRPGKVTPCPRVTAIRPTEHTAEACTSVLRCTQPHTLLRVPYRFASQLAVCLSVFPVRLRPLERICFVL